LPEHWDRAGSEAFEAFILHCLYEGRQPTLAGVTNLLFDPARKVNETIEHLMRAEHDPTGALNWRDAQGNPTPTHALVAGGMRSLLDMAEKERASVISQVKGFLGLYRDPVVAANTAASDFHIDDLVNHRRPLSLYIAVTLADQQRMRPLLRLVLAQILNRLTEKLDFRDGRAVPAGKRPLLLLIDEFASLGRLELFADSLSLIAGYGLKACLVAQSMIQIYEAYGPNQLITSHCQTKMAYRAYDMTTAREISAMTGASTVRHEHRTVSNSGASVSEPEVGRSLLTPDEVMRLGEEEMLVFTAGHHAVRAAKLRHFRYPLFNQRVGLKPPAQSDSTVSAAPAIGEQEKANDAASTAVVAVNGAAARTGAAACGAAPDRNGAATAAQHDGGQPKRFLKFATDKTGARH
jgi:type IV secretion system protein VirD4